MKEKYETFLKSTSLHALIFPQDTYRQNYIFFRETVSALGFSKHQQSLLPACWENIFLQQPTEPSNPGSPRWGRRQS